MKRLLPALLPLFIIVSWFPCAAAEERPYGPGLTEENKERLVIDDMEDVSNWSTGTPVDTTLEASAAHVKQGKLALKFGNVVDHTKGEKNYPIGWPRTSRSLAKTKLTEWSGWDFLECWIYVDTSRDALPAEPLGLNIGHPGKQRRTSNFRLEQVKKDQWVRVVIPVSKLQDPGDVSSIQFSISESNYKHGDRVDFYIDDLVLTRYVEPAIADVTLERRVLLDSERQVTARYTVMGHRDPDRVTVELSVGQGEQAVASVTGTAAVRGEGEVAVKLDGAMAPGRYWARVGLRDAEGKLIDRRQVEFRVVRGPF